MFAFGHLRPSIDEGSSRVSRDQPRKDQVLACVHSGAESSSHVVAVALFSVSGGGRPGCGLPSKTGDLLTPPPTELLRWRRVLPPRARSSNFPEEIRAAEFLYLRKGSADCLARLKIFVSSTESSYLIRI